MLNIIIININIIAWYGVAVKLDVLEYDVVAKPNIF
jgi:hypothetical protein